MEKRGKTLWEMFTERLHGGNGGGISFYNPLALRVGSAFEIPHANGPAFSGFDFTIEAIREYTRHIGGQEFKFSDYVLRGIDTKSFDANQALTLRIRVAPNTAGAYDSLLLSLEDEFAFAENFLEVVKDATGIIQITNEASGKSESFSRVNNLRVPYEAVVLHISETGPYGKATKTSPLRLEYWDYDREISSAAVRGQKEFLFVELNSESGWFQLWRGREFFR